MSERELELYRQHREGQTRYVYFLLAAAGSGIALAVNATASATLHWSLIPLGGAVLAWGVSVLAGIRLIDRSQDVIQTNAHLLRAQRGELDLPGLAHPAAPVTQEIAVKALREILEDKSSATGRAWRLQLRALVSGAGFYLAWHVLGIVLRS